MASKKPSIGARISLDGEKSYRESIANINKDMKVLSSEMKLTNAQFSDNSNSVEALRKKNETLTKQYETQQNKIETMRKALQYSAEAYGENDAKTKVWQASLNRAETELVKLDKELKTNNKYLDEAEKSTDGTAKSIDKFGKETQEAKKEVVDLNEETKNLGDGLKGFGKVLGGAFLGVAGALTAVTETTKEFRTDFAKLETNVQTAGASIEDVSKELKNLDAITGETDANIEALSNLMQAGFTGNNLADAVDALSGAVIKFPDTLKIEGLADGLQETLATGKAVGSYSELLERLGYNLDEFNDGLALCTTEADKQRYTLNILAKTGLADVNKAYRDNNKDLIANAEAQYDMRETMADIARRVMPLMNESMGTLGKIVGNVAETSLPLLTDGLDWILDNGNTIVGVLGGIGSGVATMKIGSGVTTVIDKIKQIGKESVGSKGLFNGLTSALTGNPVASAALAVGTITAAFFILKGMTNDVKSETQLYFEEIDKTVKRANDLNKEIEKGIEERKNSKNEFEIEAGSYRKLADELLRLNKIEEKSNGDKEVMKSIIDELNNVIPELNLSIDETTGYLNLQSEEIYKVIDANLELLKTKSAQEDLTRIANEQYKAEVNLRDLEEDRASLQERITLALEKRSNYNPISDVEQYTQADIELKNLEKSLNGVNVEIQNTNTNIGDLGTEFEEASKYISNSTDKSGDSVKRFGDTTVIASEEAAKALDILKKAFEEEEKSARESIESQIKLFDKFNNEIKYSNEEILANLQSQIDGVRNWSLNISKLAEMGINDGLLKELRDMGPESAQYVSALITMTDGQIEELNKLWTDKFVVADTVAEELAETKTGYNKAMTDLKTEIDNILPGWETIGKNLADGISKGFNSQFSNVKKNVRESMGSLKYDAENVLQIKSPSRVFAEIGSFTAEGFGVGFTDKMKSVTRDMQYSIPKNIDMSGNYNVSSIGTNNTKTPSIDYMQLANAVVNGITRAGLKVEMDREVMGEVISNTIRKEVF